MLNNEERVSSFVGNIKNFDWDIFLVYRLEKEDALAIVEALCKGVTDNAKKES